MPSLRMDPVNLCKNATGAISVPVNFGLPRGEKLHAPGAKRGRRAMSMRVNLRLRGACDLGQNGTVQVEALGLELRGRTTCELIQELNPMTL
jgi:hypothetical protein